MTDFSPELKSALAHLTELGTQTDNRLEALECGAASDTESIRLIHNKIEQIETLIKNSMTPAVPDRAELYKALAKAQGEIQAAEATQTAEIRKKDDYSVVLYTFKYANLADCLEVIRKPLSDNELCLIQIPSLGDNNAVHMRTVLGHSSGQTISCEMTMYPVNTNPQSIGTCMSYLRRYSLCSLVGVAQFDDDGKMAGEKDPEDYERITPEEIDSILALADDLFKDRADWVIQQMVEKTFDITHVSQIKAGEANLAITRLKNTDRREKANAKKGAANKKSPTPPGTQTDREPGSDDDK